MNDGDAADQLVIRYQPDREDVGSGRLTVRALANGFGGVAQVWVGEDRLMAIARQLETYPLPAADPPAISICYRGPDQADEEFVGLTFHSVGPRGQVGVQVHLVEPPEASARFDPPREVRLELLTTYERLRRFSLDLARVIRAELDEARLAGELLNSVPPP